MKKQVGFKTKGMNRDLSASAFNPEFSFENRNLRLTTKEGNTQMSWTCEKGTSPIKLKNANREAVTITGTPIGTAIIDSQLVLFTTEYNDIADHANKSDRIYVLEYTDVAKTEMRVKVLYYGKLNFSTKNPLETLVSFESNNIKKVYWTDNRNQPRVMNIVMDAMDYTEDDVDSEFDFYPALNLQEKVYVEKQFSGGSFAPGVIQYAFTYVNKHLQESAIIYVTPLCYISPQDRGAREDETSIVNSFKIIVTNLDHHFDTLRIYSIQRTSLNGAPLCKRLADVYFSKSNSVLTFTDNGAIGDTVDSYSLLYKNTETFVAKTLSQKDGMLFLGNVSYKAKRIDSDLANEIRDKTSLYYSAEHVRKEFTVDTYQQSAIDYANQLSAYILKEGMYKDLEPCAGFKVGEIYRYGVQFQHKNGQWSNPIWLFDDSVYSSKPSYSLSGDKLTVNISAPEATIDEDVVKELRKIGYRRVRPLVVFPDYNDRIKLCQGVLSPTMRSTDDKNPKASWFFRYHSSRNYSDGIGDGIGVIPRTNFYYYSEVVQPTEDQKIETEDYPYNLPATEIQGNFDDTSQLIGYWNIATLHSPDICHDSVLQGIKFSSCAGRIIGNIEFDEVFSNVEIQTSTGRIDGKPIADNGRINYSGSGGHGLVSGLFYADKIVDDLDNGEAEAWIHCGSPLRWFVYPWQRDGSLNNDIDMSVHTGSSKLSKKILANYRLGYLDSTVVNESVAMYKDPQMCFGDSEGDFVKVDINDNDYLYSGCVNTVLSPDKYSSSIGMLNSRTITDRNVTTPWDYYKNFTLNYYRITANNTAANLGYGHGVYLKKSSGWSLVSDSGIVGNVTDKITIRKDNVRMKYKSTPHLVLQLLRSFSSNVDIPVVDIEREHGSNYPYFGGTSKEALKSNTWIPCGRSVPLKESGYTTFRYEYGDTYFQRWDCLKTYPFSSDDVNQIVEIGSFVLETRMNMDGRYDRNRGKTDNLSMNYENFDLLNTVYTQQDNFFTYKIVDDEDIENTDFPNWIAYSLTKEAGSDVDIWTAITLGSVLELDGNKGKINKLVRFNDQILAFQDNAFCQILYNENVQISSTAGVPIEIANSEKVRGKRYISETIGCSNPASMVATPNGIYFMSTDDKSIYRFNGELANLSNSLGFNTWSKQNIPDARVDWNPKDFANFKSCYDMQNQEVMYINDTESLHFSELFGVFTSFYDYGDTPYFENFESTGLWVRKDGTLWKHQANEEYCNFFGTNKPYWMTLIANPEPQRDKTFTNLEFRACVDGDGSLVEGKFTPSLPFDSLESWDEYQHGYTPLEYKRGHEAMLHGGESSALNRKFRIWRCDIPRDNAEIDTDAAVGVTRFQKHPNDRMRNPWVYLKLTKNAPETGSLPRTEIHDMVVTYFD